MKQAVPAGEEIPFEPAEERVLRQHFHDAPVRRQLTAVGVFWQHVGHPGLLAGAVQGLQSVGRRFIRPEDAEVLRIVLHHIAKELTERLGVFVLCGPTRADLDSVLPDVRKLQFAAKHAAIGVRVRTHTPIAHRRRGADLRLDAAVGIEQLLGLIAAQPVFEHLQIARVVPHIGERNLVRTPRSFQLVSVHLAGAGPAFR